MIRDKLIPILKQNFSETGFYTQSSPQPIVVFPAKHPSVGELSIWDDGCEAMIGIGRISHSHITPFDSELKQDDLETEVVKLIVEFLNDMFADKYLLFKSGEESGGWQHLDYLEKPFKVYEDTEYFVWSGPFNVKNLK